MTTVTISSGPVFLYFYGSPEESLPGIPNPSFLLPDIIKGGYLVQPSVSSTTVNYTFNVPHNTPVFAFTTQGTITVNYTDKDGFPDTSTYHPIFGYPGPEFYWTIIKSPGPFSFNVDWNIGSSTRFNFTFNVSGGSTSSPEPLLLGMASLPHYITYAVQVLNKTDPSSASLFSTVLTTIPSGSYAAGIINAPHYGYKPYFYLPASGSSIPLPLSVFSVKVSNTTTWSLLCRKCKTRHM